MKRFLFFVFMVVLAVLGFVGLLAYSGATKAATILGNEESCYSLAVATQRISALRDAGVSWESVKPDIEAALQEAKGNSDSYVQDDDDAEFVLGTFEILWALPDDASEITSLIYSLCIAYAPVKIE